MSAARQTARDGLAAALRHARTELLERGIASDGMRFDPAAAVPGEETSCVLRVGDELIFTVTLHLKPRPVIVDHWHVDGLRAIGLPDLAESIEQGRAAWMRRSN